jgi:hypothetical protein
VAAEIERKTVERVERLKALGEVYVHPSQRR